MLFRSGKLANVSSRHHDAISSGKDIVVVVDRLCILNLRENLNVSSGAQALSDLVDVLGLSDT